MHLELTPEDLAFRDEVRAFIEGALPVNLRFKQAEGRGLEKDDVVQWQRILHARGWGAPSWPVAHGGTGWTAVQRHLFDEACADAGAPLQLPFGLKMVAPVIMQYGSDAQKAFFLPRILSGEHWWCQGYSEPGAGSDLASLTTRAVRSHDADGEHYRVQGQKTWTTLAQHADWIFCLVRTGSEGRPQEGITFLLIDMKSPGVEVRPIRMLDGEHEVNEVWLEGVRVPVEHRVGDENRGWTYAKFLLGHERTGIAGVGRSKAALRRLKALAHAQPGDDGRPLIEDIRFRDRIARVELELMALEVTNFKVIAAEDQHRPPGPAASMLKIKGSEIQQLITELTMHALGPLALPHVPRGGTAPVADGSPTRTTSTGAAQYFNQRKTTIYGGSSEVQKNIIAQMILGL